MSGGHTLPAPCVALDLEVNPDSRAILKIGAVNPGTGATLSFQRAFQPQSALKRLDGFCREAEFLLGHNISRHDLPFLRAHAPGLGLGKLPLIDTLFLSPLAFPKNPYHRLVKDYKIVRQAVNDPVADARCAVSLFFDQLTALAEMPHDLLGLYGRLLHLSFPHDGYERLFQWLTGHPLPDPVACPATWFRQTTGLVCRNQGRAVFDEIIKQPDGAACLAYTLAWLRVAGENSVLPPWVRHQFPEIPGLLDRLRADPCLKSECAYCREHHDSILNLKRWFGFDGFRPLKQESPPLQQRVTDAIVRGENCLAVLPTGYGKSVCYQLPALMKARQRNRLSLIISPLQSLMKDQVDAMKRLGILNTGAVNSLLTLPERSRILEEVRLGGIDLLWLAPEQLRNTGVKAVLKQREPGLLIIDEAHCFSKWGHDFRPDYLSIVKFVLEICGGDAERFPQVACFTATARTAVIEEIRGYFREQPGLELTLFPGGHDRPNLHYVAENVVENEKAGIIHERLTQVLEDIDRTGGGIVFAATRQRVELFSRILADKGWAVDFYHGQRPPEDKRQVQERFSAGELRVIVATNAFGMGVDKPDVRVVIHADVPGSLENYLQEAGRAGRDGDPAWCFLLFNEEDMETQFRLGALGRVEWRDLSGMLTGLKHLAARDPDRTVVLTSGELLRSREVEAQHLETLSPDETMYDTRVKTALAWLERSGKLVRGDNRTQVIQGRVLVENRDQARRKIERCRLSRAEKSKWMDVLEVLMQADPKELLNTDQLSLAVGLEPRELLSVLHAMRDAGIVNHDLNMTAYLHRGVADDSKKVFDRCLELEKALLSLMEETEPDLDPERPCVFNLRALSQQLKDRGHDQARPDRILPVLDLMMADNLLRPPFVIGEGIYRLSFKQNWQNIRRVVEERNAVGGVILADLLTRLPSGARGRNLLVAFRSGELQQALTRDLTTAHLNNIDDRIQKGLLALHAVRAVCLQSGLTVFRPAMTVTVTADPAERFARSEYAPLGEHYREKTVQVHIIGRYAELAVSGLKKALEFVGHYFRLDRPEFLRLYFRNQQELLDLQTTAGSMERIVKQLNNPVQERIVTAPLQGNLLIVAGPGSGKTRVLVHRIAYLIRVRRVPPQQILAVAFNRGAVTQLKLRLKELIGRDAAWVRVRTYHSLAMRIAGRSLAGKPPDRNGSEVFRRVLEEAVRIMTEASAGDQDALGWRERLLSGLRFILVDEYQDIDELEYRFLSLLAGRNEQETGRRPTLLAVGDDDQNIYAWKGASVRFIRAFEADYRAGRLEMNVNYRSRRAVIEASNALIARNRDRMKTGPITPAATVDREEPEADRGEVVIVRAPDEAGLARVALTLAAASGDAVRAGEPPGSTCILCRTNDELYRLREMARRMEIPATVIRPFNLPLVLTREFRTMLEGLRQSEKTIVGGKALSNRVEALIAAVGFSKENNWIGLFKAILDHYLGETLGADRPVEDFIDYVHDVSRDPRQFQQANGDRILLATMHVAKGLEFDTVIIAGQPIATAGIEEERRLYYVAMTRARGRLYCLHHQQADHPFISEIAGAGEPWVSRREEYPTLSGEERRVFETVVWEQELSDVVISFPAFKNVIRHAAPLLSRIEPGDAHEFDLCERGNTVVITWQRRPVARLSAGGVRYCAGLKAAGYAVAGVSFMAAIYREKSAEAEAYRHLNEAESWYTGLFRVEFVKPELSGFQV